MLNGALAKYLTDEEAAADLAQALKIAINSVYGLTAARFTHQFKDPRNKDNIVAKRGALFMVNLKHEVQKRGFTVAHIKTDSIKIPGATPEIIQFVTDYYFTDQRIVKVYRGGLTAPSGVSLNWLIDDDCEIERVIGDDLKGYLPYGFPV